MCLLTLFSSYFSCAWGVHLFHKIVVCPAEGRERARVVPRAHKDSLSLYPAERQERNTLGDVNAFRQRNKIIFTEESLDFVSIIFCKYCFVSWPKMFTSKAFYPRDLLLGTSFALLGVPSRTARTFTPFCRAHNKIVRYSIEISSLAWVF